MITQGTWEVSKHEDNGETVVRADDGRIIANLECDRHMLDDDEVHDNAQAISALPELLAVAKRYIRQVEGTYAEMGKKPTNTQYYLTVEAIKKAEDKQ